MEIDEENYYHCYNNNKNCDDLEKELLETMKKIKKIIVTNESFYPIKKRDKDPYEMLEELDELKKERIDVWKNEGFYSFKNFYLEKKNDGSMEYIVDWNDDAIYDEKKQQWIITNCILDQKKKKIFEKEKKYFENVEKIINKKIFESNNQDL